jgi:hypothetical protein
MSTAAGGVSGGVAGGTTVASSAIFTSFEYNSVCGTTSHHFDSYGKGLPLSYIIGIINDDIGTPLRVLPLFYLIEEGDL